mgnify:CR=1 FL=1
MANYLIVGVETVVGANLAVHLAEHAGDGRLLGLSAGAAVSLEGCPTRQVKGVTSADAQQYCRESEATHVVLCGAAARSSWEPDAARFDDRDIEFTRMWAGAARAAGARLTVISSDAVFTGPWLFHEEDAGGLSDDPQSQRILAAEQQALEAHPEALLVRTNAFGWSPLGEAGWIEQRLAQLQTRRLADQDFIRHATPILATDLAGILLRAWGEELQGLYHIAGAERVSPLKFVQRLAEQYHLPWLSIRRTESLQERASGFAAGECSLQTKKIRKAICVAMPILSEGLARLVEQDTAGFRRRLCPTAPRGIEKAA